MRNATFLSVSACAITVAGCSTYPLPQDYSRKYTVDIVKHIRCEVAEGVRSLPPATPEELEGTVIGFDFTFKMTEDNNATSGVLGFTNPVGGGTFKLDLSGSAEKKRFNERAFRVIDTMAKLRDEPDCSIEDQRRNFAYPIAGRIGLEELVHSYWQVRDLSTFTPGEDKRFFTDKLTFTTTLSAGISPNLEVKAAGADFKLTNASIDGDLVRKDEHQVTVAIVQSVAKKVVKVPVRVRVPQPRHTPDMAPGAESAPSYRTIYRDQTRVVPNTPAATQSVIEELNRQRDRDDDRDFGVRLNR